MVYIICIARLVSSLVLVLAKKGCDIDTFPTDYLRNRDIFEVFGELIQCFVTFFFKAYICLSLFSISVLQFLSVIADFSVFITFLF